MPTDTLPLKPLEDVTVTVTDPVVPPTLVVSDDVDADKEKSGCGGAGGEDDPPPPQPARHTTAPAAKSLAIHIGIPPMQRLLGNLSTLQFVDYHRACGTRYSAAAVSIRGRNLASDPGRRRVKVCFFNPGCLVWSDRNVS
jgi:hypothetical protein